MSGTLYYGDNLDIFRHRDANGDRDYLKSNSVDLIYLDPPFQSGKSYNIIFEDEDGKSEAQVEAFSDTWKWSGEFYKKLLDDPEIPENVKKLIKSLCGDDNDTGIIGKNSLTAYLVMMAPRLVEMKRILKDTGSLYLHCDQTVAAYIKVLLDNVFGAENFRNEIIWQRSGGQNFLTNKYIVRDDRIFYYVKSKNFVFNKDFQKHSDVELENILKFSDVNDRKFALYHIEGVKSVPGTYIFTYNNYTPSYGWLYNEEEIKKFDADQRIYWTANGRPRLKYFKENIPGIGLGTIWTDIKPISSQAAERLGYPTQKPEALLERIIKASSNEGDLVLDPFCGCGTAVVVAEKLKRNWIGIDITHLAVNLIKKRLPDTKFEVIGEPKDLAGAKVLADKDKYQFQYWALSLIDKSMPIVKKKGADRGIDGVLYIKNITRPDEPVKVLIQVKGGHVTSSQIRDFNGTIDREKAYAGIFITLEEPTRNMYQEINDIGSVKSILGSEIVPKIEIMTIEKLLQKVKPRITTVNVGIESMF
jgi:site-specific DNA-methyltransferase (adenine-specific)